MHRQTTAVATSMPSSVQNDASVDFFSFQFFMTNEIDIYYVHVCRKSPVFAVGNRVLVNGLKSGTILYVGLVKFVFSGKQNKRGLLR